MTLVYVMGPSGAGKDTVLRLARASLTAGERIAFAHRYVTRPADPRHENFVSLNSVEFATRNAAGLFALDWAAHGFHYGIGVEIDAWRQAGFVVVVSGSRAHFTTLRPRPAGLIPVLITAPPETLAQRLAARGREDPAAQAERLRRARRFTPVDPGLVTIDNSGPLERATDVLLKLLRR
jgi:ribose 1,5-bisphosphokinase